MKHFSRLVIFFSILLLTFCVLPQFAKAIGNPDDPGGDPDAPIDGGVIILMVAGVVYGVKKIKDEQKKKLSNLP
jgi:hypothetical protein